MDNTAILEVKDLRIRFVSPTGDVMAIRGLNFQVNRNEVLALVGESGRTAPDSHHGRQQSGGGWPEESN